MDSQEFSKSGLDTKALLKPYLKNWKWFAVSIIAALILGFLLIRYSTPEYAIQSKIQVLEDQAPSSELAALQDINILGGRGNQITDEIETLGSRTNFLEVIKELGLNKKIIELGNLKNTEQYINPSLNLIVPADSIIYNADIDFLITPKNSTTFEFALEEDNFVKVYTYGTTFETPVGDVVITPNVAKPENLVGRKYLMSIRPLAAVAENYQKKVLITATNELTSRIIGISLNDAIIQRGKDVLNGLVSRYNENAIRDKKTIADRTSSFINDRIADIYGDLSSVDQSAEDFKAGRGIADIGTQTSVNLNIGAASQQELQNASVQLDIASSMKDLMDSQEGYEVLPANVGLADPTIASTTARYNELALERKRLLESSNEKNPIIVNLDQQLDGLKRSMKSSLNTVTNNLSLQVNSLSSQLSKINSRIYSAPKNERALRDITRQQQTTESLYLYLLQKREESQIAFASATPKSNVIDRAYLASKDPVSPKKILVFLASFILGSLIPFGIIYVKDLMDNKIHSKADLEALINSEVPILGDLPRLSKKDRQLVHNDDRSVLSESLRILRTNLDYLIKSDKNSNKVIYITSSTSGEGKTFLSSNLAMIFANTGKKVLLVGADIRNPKLYDFFTDTSDNIDNMERKKDIKELGLTEYLYDDSLSFSDVVNSMLVYSNTIDVVYSGKIPPNPAELLMSERLKELLKTASEKYDYVIVDTAPLMVVTDTLLISEYANQIVYVTRAGATEKNVIEYPLKLKKEGKLKGLSFVVNDVKESDLGYGGKYGYGYGKTQKKWWKLV
ncbi:GumC family protein [Flagellimonas meridianipacifica]|uniref:non-specific protein-tyrosine kinase n=1 Tax=Flagellimonas meridianipacifica TaxID=1080225 RepID=A0A2T0MCS0_9FLAO|nr:polysaccharide biosynthesis tyrosine autokinase [Allomuricauda pacifica]PRX55282.1 capsular exopolysaccharide synthesis family protein [Allomuricauda pacifica]